VPSGQRLVFEELDDGVLMYDALVGGTHLINVTAQEALELLLQAPGLTAAELHARVLERLELDAAVLPLDAMESLLQRLAELDIVAAQHP